MSCHENAKKRRFHGWTNPVLISGPSVLFTLHTGAERAEHELCDFGLCREAGRRAEINNVWAAQVKDLLLYLRWSFG
jgi:hypothetical protein